MFKIHLNISSELLRRQLLYPAELRDRVSSNLFNLKKKSTTFLSLFHSVSLRFTRFHETTRAKLGQTRPNNFNSKTVSKESLLPSINARRTSDHNSYTHKQDGIWQSVLPTLRSGGISGLNLYHSKQNSFGDTSAIIAITRALGLSASML